MGRRPIASHPELWPYLGKREGIPGEDPGASCLWAGGTSWGHIPPELPVTWYSQERHPIDITPHARQSCVVGLPFNGGCVPLGPGLWRGAEPSWLHQGTRRDSESGLTGPVTQCALPKQHHYELSPRWCCYQPVPALPVTELGG